MKTIKIFAVKRLLISAAFAAAAVLAIAACTPFVDPAEGTPFSSGKGGVAIQLGVDGSGAAPAASAARTLLPTAASLEFDSYKLTFTPASGEPVTLSDVTSLTGIELNTGTYTLELEAYKGGELAAEGAASSIGVTEGHNTQVTVPLTFKPGAGNGTLAFTVSRPADLALTDAQFVLTPLYDGETPNTTDWLWILYNEHAGKIATIHTATEDIASGYYLAVVTLSTGERTAKKNDIVHIGAGQTTPLNWTFEESDFATAVDYIRLVGIPDWGSGAPNAVEPDTENPDGTYTWLVEADAKATFRFILDDTSSYDDKWWARWFHPETNETDVSVPDSYEMKFSEGKPNLAWKLETAGYYSLTVDPYAKTFEITKPTVITGVTINEGDVSLNKGGNKTFTATVQGHNNPSQTVTWAVSGNNNESTAFDEDTLTVAAEETAETLTVTATAENGIQSPPVTVTVTAANTPTVVFITVTAADSVTEVLRGNTLQFNAQVEVTNDADQTVSWSVAGKNKDGEDHVLNGTSINESGQLTVGADETAVDLVVTATSTVDGFGGVAGSAKVFVRKHGEVYLIGDEFGNWTETGVKMDYEARGVYATTQLMLKTKSFRFNNDSGTVTHFEPYPDGQAPSGTPDAWAHLEGDTTYLRTAWTTTTGGSYAISLDTVTEKVTFVRTDVANVTVEVTYGYPMTAVTKINEDIAPNASVTWTVEKSGEGDAPYNNTSINQEGWLTVDNYEPSGKEMIVRATSHYNESVSGTSTFTISTYPNVWLVGDPQSWTLPGASMERSQDGQTFTWQGTIQNNYYFRFGRSGDGGENWTRDWLGIEWNDSNPRTISTDSSGDECKVAKWDNQNPDGNRANWQFSGSTGTYKIILNVANESAMTISIEAVGQ